MIHSLPQSNTSVNYVYTVIGLLGGVEFMIIINVILYIHVI